MRSRVRCRRSRVSPPASASAPPTSRPTATGAAPSTREGPQLPAASRSWRKSCATRSESALDRRDHADTAARAALLPDRAPRPRGPRRSPRPHVRAPRGPAAGARRRARASRRRRRAGDGQRPRRRRDAEDARRALRSRAAPRGARGGGGRRDRPPAPARHGGRPRRAGRPIHRADEDGPLMPADRNDKALLRRYHEHGDLQAREQLIEQYMSLVRSLARRYSYRGEQLEDLVQIGAIGLIKAIDRFDLDRGVELTTYATPNIIGEIKRHFRDRGWSVRVPRGLQELNVQLSKLVEQLTVQLERSPTIAELAKAAGVEEEEVLEALESGQAYATLSLSATGGGGSDDGSDLDPLESLGEIEHEYEVSEDRAVLAPGLRALDDRERRILHLRFFEGLTQSQIAQQVGISQMHVSRLIRRALEKIRAEIATDGMADRRAS